MFLSGMVIMAGAVINAAHIRAVDSACEDLGRVWAGSILGEYDRVLRDRYGFYGYYGNEEMVRKKLERYADQTFKDKKYIKRSEIECFLSEYKLTDPEIFREQLKKIMTSFWAPKPLADETGGTGEGQTDTEGYRYISAGWILEGLPSHCIRSGISGKGGSSLLEIGYILKSFKDHVDDRDLGKTYFRNEIEYIITGKPSDEKARKWVYGEIMAERNALNLAYLYKCTAKREAAMEAAVLITPGPEAVITQALILEIWALMEARNDMELLYAGERVPLIKGDANWALGIEGAVKKAEGKSEDGELDTREERKYVEPERIEGQKYSDYLTTLLIAVPEGKRILRIMDLIQINLKYAYCDSFLMEDHFAGLDYSMTVNGREHTYHDEYK